MNLLDEFLGVVLLYQQAYSIHGICNSGIHPFNQGQRGGDVKVNAIQLKVEPTSMPTEINFSFDIVKAPYGQESIDQP